MSIDNSLLDSLRLAVREVPDDEFVRFAGVSFTYSAALKEVEAFARGLRELGIDAGDRVGVMCDNRPEVIWSWLGTNAARAIDVPFNAEARGRLLAYFVEDAEPRALIGTEDYLQILADTIAVDPEFVICIGEHTTQPFGDRAKQLTFDQVRDLGTASTVELPAPGPGETATIMYTSGTTGPSKGVMLPQRYYPANAAHCRAIYGMTSDEVIYCVQPLFHIDARAFLSSILDVRATLVLGRRFSVSRFWNEVRENGVTMFATIGTMLWLLHKQPPSPSDKDHGAVVAACSSTPREVLRAFEERFGVNLIEAYGMTECVLLASAPANQTRPGRIGKPIAEIDSCVVNGDDAPVALGETGELVFRPRDHNAMMQGYWNKPEATLETWRNLWFHTGDLVREDEDGYLEYIGRKKDSIRRRGENISAWEVEEAVAAHSKVQEVAAIGVPSDVGEEDLAVIIVPIEGQTIDPAELLEFVKRDLPKFAVPRYVEFVDSLPKTPSERIEKGKVRERGISSAAWDADAALSR